MLCVTTLADRRIFKTIWYAAFFPNNRDGNLHYSGIIDGIRIISWRNDSACRIYTECNNAELHDISEPGSESRVQNKNKRLQ